MNPLQFSKFTCSVIKFHISWYFVTIVTVTVVTKIIDIIWFRSHLSKKMVYVSDIDYQTDNGRFVSWKNIKFWNKQADLKLVTTTIKLMAIHRQLFLTRQFLLQYSISYTRAKQGKTKYLPTACWLNNNKIPNRIFWNKKKLLKILSSFFCIAKNY